MRTRIAWVGLAVTGAAAAGSIVARRLRIRQRQPSWPLTSDPEDELRRKLDESRALASERDEFESGETTVDQAEPASVDERRRQVHAEAESAMREMGSQNEPEPPSTTTEAV